MSIHKKEVKLLLNLYAYNHLFDILAHDDTISGDLLFILESLKERRELNINFLFDHRELVDYIEAKYQVKMIFHGFEDELLVNYIYDLEAKIRNGKIIDFVRAVSPIIYRLFEKIVKSKIPHFNAYIINSKNDQYDFWKFHEMSLSTNKAIRDFISQKRDIRVTSGSLSELIQYLDISDEVKGLVVDLRLFEKSVRNPLAHLIRPFDEEELYQTTGFSSKIFLDKIIRLLIHTGVDYNRHIFYFDDINNLVLKLY